ncbi:MAG: carboxypeptidase-like regulatory domain-containing protein [Gemmatimonadota bacterium]
MRIPLVVLAIACSTAAGARAQTVRGLFSDSVSRTPLPGVFVTLVDTQGTERARTITNQAGAFVLSAPTPGTYRIRSKRIGLHPYVSQPLTLRAGETISYDAVVLPIPVPLEQVVVAGDRQCDVDGGASVAALWEEVREALAAVRWTRSAPGYWYVLRQFEREILSSGSRGAHDSVWQNAGFYQAPFSSVPAEQLAADGFVVQDGSGWNYFAPEAEALLSEPFLRTHCFETKLGKGETAGLMGLMFSPARGRKLPDVAGTLWVDRQTAELRHLEFKYVQLPSGLADPRAGGRVAFMRVPTGAWIVHEWVIRMPIAQAAEASASGIPEFSRVRGLRERGGMAEQIKTSAGTLVFSGGGDSRKRTVDTIPVAPTAAQVLPPAALPPGSAVVMADDTNRAARRSHSSEILTKEEFEGSTASDAFGLVQQYRPTWLLARPPSGLDPTSGQVEVYLNGVRSGPVSRLRDIPARAVREMRYVSASEAKMRYGVTNDGPVIAVQAN